MPGVGGIGPVNLPPDPQQSGIPLKGYSPIAYDDAWDAYCMAAGIATGPVGFDGNSPSVTAAYQAFEKLFHEVSDYTPPPPPTALCDQLLAAGNHFIAVAQAAEGGLSYDNQQNVKKALAGLKQSLFAFSTWIGRWHGDPT